MSRSEEPLSTIYLDGAPKTPFGGNVYVTPGKADGLPDLNPTAKDRTTSGTVGQDTKQKLTQREESERKSKEEEGRKSKERIITMNYRTAYHRGS